MRRLWWCASPAPAMGSGDGMWTRSGERGAAKGGETEGANDGAAWRLGFDAPPDRWLGRCWDESGLPSAASRSCLHVLAEVAVGVLP